MKLKKIFAPILLFAVLFTMCLCLSACGSDMSDYYTNAMAESAHTSMDNEIAAMKTRYEAEIAALKAKDSEQASQTQTALAELQKELGELKSACAEEYDELHALIDNLEDAIELKDQAITELKTDIESCIDEIAELKSQVADLIDAQTVTVLYELGNGESDIILDVQRCSHLEKPTTPTRNGYTFAGWYCGNVKWDFDTDIIVENTILTAKWLRDDNTGWTPPAGA